MKFTATQVLVLMLNKECIDQEDPADKEVGIQVMDKVYKRAFLSITPPTVQMLSPGDERSMHVKWTYRAGLARPRRSCNAAVALSYLRLREDTQVSDRLAAIANLCNYDVRLNPIEIRKDHQYLGPCIFALALLNGDSSLLYREVYKGLETYKGLYPVL